MWPVVDLEEGKILISCVTKQKNEEECRNPDTIIKEIVMLYSLHSQVSYNQDEVPLAVEYDTEYGIHLILFSKVKNLKYEDRGNDWIKVYTSDENSDDLKFNDGEYVSEDKLTQMFFNMVEEATDESELPELPKIPEIIKNL